MFRGISLANGSTIFDRVFNTIFDQSRVSDYQYWRILAQCSISILFEQINFYSSWNHQKIYTFLMIPGGIEVNRLAHTRLILGAKYMATTRKIEMLAKGSLI